MRLSPIAPAALAALLAAQPAAAEPYAIDRSHANIGFSVDHLGFSTIQGHFQEFDAEIDFDPEAVEETELRFTIDPASIYTGWEKRDAHLRSDDFFAVEQHPEIVFVSKEVRPTGEDTAEIVGDLTIRDITREVVFDAELNKVGPSPFDPEQTIAGFTATTVLDRTGFGLGYAAPDVAAEVPIRIDLEMSPAG